MSNEQPRDLTNFLSSIVASARVRAAAMSQAEIKELERRAAACQPHRGEFVRRLSRKDTINVIAECKRWSPSKGVLRSHYDVAEIAESYHRFGAAAISVLTEPNYFGGSLDDLRSVREQVPIPVLRKDFIVDERQVVEARAAGADAILLIVAALEAKDIRRLMNCASSYGLGVLLEAHSEDDLNVALDSGAMVVGVNARDLRTMAVRMETLEALASRFPRGIVAVAESGIKTKADILRLRSLGYQAFLVGEQLVTSSDPGKALAKLTGGVPACS